MSKSVVISYTTVMDGLVLRWFRTERDASNHRSFLSASRDGIDLFCESPPQRAVVDAHKVRELLKNGRDEDAERYVTHRFTRFMGDQIEPVVRAES